MGRGSAHVVGGNKTGKIRGLDTNGQTIEYGSIRLILSLPLFSGAGE